jgi:Zn finger protein HypA/HybF involved in hydrogenase expression
MKEEKCKFCQKEFEPKNDSFFGTLEQYLCPECNDLMIRFTKDVIIHFPIKKYMDRPSRPSGKVVYARCDDCGYEFPTELVCPVCDNEAVTVSTEKSKKVS